MSMFEYEVITPQTAATYIVKALSYGDELDLRSALLATTTSIISKFNKVLFKSIVQKPEEIKSFNDFLTKTTIEDRNALTYGLYHTSYGDKFITETVCPNCGTTNENKVSITKLARGQAFKGKPFEFLQMSTQFQVDSSISFTLSPATLYKESIVSKQTENMDLSPRLSNILLHIENLVIESRTFTIKDNVIDIISQIKSLPPKIVRELSKKTETFTKFKVDVPYRVTCPKCNTTYVRSLDFVGQFFRSIVDA